MAKQKGFTGSWVEYKFVVIAPFCSEGLWPSWKMLNFK
ncbi:hypothetical protein FLA_0379 [Filimonas lacunae]|nr:hypothetical protein FLA_0379 [Filimonas lacunae]